MAGDSTSRGTEVLAIGILDAQTARNVGRKAQAGESKWRGVFVTAAITVLKSHEEVYAFWRDFENLPRFMAHEKVVLEAA